VLIADCCTGELDFIINSDYRWGIELMRGDGNISEHLRRYAPPDGKYRCFPLREYRVVHFKMAPWSPQTIDANYVAVILSADGKTATVLFHNAQGERSTTTLQLLA